MWRCWNWPKHLRPDPAPSRYPIYTRSSEKLWKVLDRFTQVGVKIWTQICSTLSSLSPLLLFKVEHSQQFGKWRPSYWETISYIKAYWISLVFWKYFGQLFMMMLLLLISCLESLGHLFFSPFLISLSSQVLNYPKASNVKHAHFYIVLENAWGGWEKRLLLRAMWF